MNFNLSVGQIVNDDLFKKLESYACPTGWDSDSVFSDTSGYIIAGREVVLTAWSYSIAGHILVYKASFKDADKDRFSLRIYLMDPEDNDEMITESERIEKILNLIGLSEADPTKLIPILDLLSRACGYARHAGWLK